MSLADGSQGRVFPFRCPESEEEGDEIRDRMPRTLNGEKGLKRASSQSLMPKRHSVKIGGRHNSKGLCMAKMIGNILKRDNKCVCNEPLMRALPHSHMYTSSLYLRGFAFLVHLLAFWSRVHLSMHFGNH